ncbi:peptide chain release factor 2 [Pontiella sulfatireligans]|uniref:Peptide chain release factor 2 n=1 Tax=Pontiella sulfatireligans TaxID=2750658 RepID=A0A6C2UQP4_9BACT|nr:peptide chain release factor 2 [Pontiella sulfatireligans]VGO21591.1 Peptide chain release factor 2 [Pontiella sulfatireligans]
MTNEELKAKIASFREQLSEMEGYLDIVAKRVEQAKLEAVAAEPDFWNDQNKAQANIAASKALKLVLGPFEAIGSSLDDAEVMLELAEAGEDEALAEAASEIKKVESGFRSLEMQSLLGGEFDANGAYLTLHAGAGGTESCDWADMLYRMFNRYAERKEFKAQIMDYQAGEEAGIKSVTLLISGAYAYGLLKSERGVHRLVRISPFDSQSRRHTSFAAVDVTPEIDDDIQIDIVESDLRIDTYRAQGAGGQHVNTTDSAVRIVHLPTGTVVQCQAERSQHKNKAAAMKMLKARLYEHEQDKKRKAVEQLYGDKGEIAWGSQIRSYVLQPYTQVKDHRTDEVVGNAAGVLDGNIDPFIEAYLKKNR